MTLGGWGGGQLYSPVTGVCMPLGLCRSRSLSAASGVGEGSLSVTESVVAVRWRSECESSDEYESSEYDEYDRLAALEVKSLLCADAPGRSMEPWRESRLRCILVCTHAPHAACESWSSSLGSQ